MLFTSTPLRRPFTTLAATLGVVLACSAAQAAPADDARTHFQAIASGDLPTLMKGYADNAQFVWVGGPLDGSYSGTEAIRGVWTKFAGATPFKLQVDKLETAANPKGATVTANVQLEGKATVKVRYVLTFRDGKIVNEVWQIDPQLNVAAAY